MTKKIAVCGGAGFIGWHLCKRLRADGNFVVAIDRKYPEFAPQHEWPADEYHVFDLLNSVDYYSTIARWQDFDEVYQLAAEMGGAGYIFTGEHDAEIMHNSARINLNVLEICRMAQVKKVFFASSACVYESLKPFTSLVTADADGKIKPVEWLGQSCKEQDAGNPDSAYGWEKMWAEKLYAAYAQQHGMQVRIGRFHNVFGPYGTWQGGREKAPAAFCRKIAETEIDNADGISCYGDGEQTRSFLFVDEAVEAVIRLMASDFQGPVNIGSSEMVTINTLISMLANISGKTFGVNHIDGPLGVRGRNSDNTLIEQKLGWKPTGKLYDGLKATYPWVAEQVKKRNKRLAEIAKTG